MQENQSATLAKKIESARFDISIYPHLEDLALNIGKASISTLSELTGAYLQLSKTDVSAKQARQALQDSDGERVLYWSVCAQSNYNVFVSFSSTVAASLSEAALGGDFNLGNTEEKATLVDSEILCFVIDSILASFRKYPFPKIEVADPQKLGRAQIVSSADNIIKSLQNATYCNLSFDLGLDESKAKSAVTFHFPIDYLESYGLLSKGRKFGVDSIENSRWRHDMLANVNKSEIELDFILDSYKAPLSDLAKLEVGQFVHLSENPERSLSIMLNTSNGSRAIGTGRLGVCQNSKAVKITSPLDPAECKQS